jgi:hypothetical protein
MSLIRTVVGRILLVVLVISATLGAANAQPALSIGPGYIVTDKIDKPLLGLTGTYRIGKWVPNIVASWSDPWGWEPNIIRSKVGYAFAKHKHGVVLIEGGADAIRIRDNYEWFGAATLSSVVRLGKQGRWVLAGAYRPENDSWAVITRFNVVLWSGK